MPTLWGLLLLAALLAVAFAAAPPFRAEVTAFWQKHWGDKGVSGQMNSARVAQALAMGMSSGLPLEEALTLAAGLVEDVPAASARCLRCRELLEGGESLGNAMRTSGLLPAGPCRLLEMAHLTEESDAALAAKVSRVEPALVLACSVLVGLILLSVMLPLMHIMSAIG